MTCSPPFIIPPTDDTYPRYGGTQGPRRSTRHRAILVRSEHSDLDPGWTFGSNCYCGMRRRNPRAGRILDCSGAAAAVHRGLVSDQHTSRLARGKRLRRLYAGRHPSGRRDRSLVRPTYLSRLEHSEWLSCFGIALCDSLLPALAFRALAGIAMAGMYMPGLQALTQGLGGTVRARIAAWYTSSFTIGASLSFLFGRVGTLLGWRGAFAAASILGVAGVLIAWAALPREDAASDADPQPLLDFRPVLANRDALILIVGYAATIWGCVGLRQWIVVFLTFCAGDQAAVPAQVWVILVVGALISFLGVPAGLLGNELSIRYGLRAIATLVFLLSALTGGLFGFAATLPYIAVLGLSLVAGFIVQGNFSNLTSGVLAVAAPRHRGATIGLYSCIGFGAGFLGTLLFGVTLDQFGGTSHLGAWVFSFGTCGLACLAGAGATIFLPRDVWYYRG